MRVGIEWLREWVDIEEEAAGIAERFTTLGLEVESIEAPEAALQGVVVAQVVSRAPHPDAAKLSVCIVGAGSKRAQVVCGAPNVVPGLKVALALPGAVLPQGRQIAATRIHGVESEGMLCSEVDLGLGDRSDSLLELDAESRSGEALWSELRLGDPVLEIGITPNRGDCFSVLGLARELAAATGRPLRRPVIASPAVEIDDTFDVALHAPTACPKLAGRLVRGLSATARTPFWLAQRLRRAGLRPLHPLVDVTNYVMLELGQPLHAYDAAKLSGVVSARHAVAGERLRLLDGREVALANDVLVIADASGPIGLAGIMGGASTAVSDDTADVFLESAYFSPQHIAGRPRRYGLHTDASLRFERGVDPTGQASAIERATGLIQVIAGGRAGPVRLEEVQEALPPLRTVPLRHRRLAAVLGFEPEAEHVTTLLERLEMGIERSDEGWQVTPPPFRFDIAIEEDLIEEVGRSLGYDTIPVQPGEHSLRLGTSSEYSIELDRAADELAARGYNEVINFGFVSERQSRAVDATAQLVHLENPLSQDLAVLRHSLWPGLLLTAQRNQSYQQSRLRLFEVGTQFSATADGIAEETVIAGFASGSHWPEQWGEKPRPVDFYDVKADVEALLALAGRDDARFVAAELAALRPGQAARIGRDGRVIGWVGAVHPNVRKEFDLRQPAFVFALSADAALQSRPVTFHPYSRFPWIRRDIALLVPLETVAGELLESIRIAGGSLLRNAFVFDVYAGENIDLGRKSIAVGLILQGTSRTLTDEEADRTVQSIMQRLQTEFGARIRN